VTTATVSAPLARADVTLDGHTGRAAIGQTLFDCAEMLGVAVPTSCQKQGKCRECLVEIESGAACLSAPAPQESHLEGRFRLACRARIAAPGSISGHTLRRGALRIETGSAGLGDERLELDPAVTRDGPRVLLDGVPVAQCDGPLHGLALDLVTTTVALRLYDLESGRLLATQSFENPQRFGGSDVMARIHYDGAHQGRLLQRTLLAYLRHAIEGLPVDPGTIFELVVAGNSTMRDLLFGIDVQGLGVLPFQSATEARVRGGQASTTSLTASARKLRLPLHPAARIYGLPLIGSHVGADAAACLLATGLGDGAEICALLDIGTNTEVVLGNRDRILAASCPAGPAFEGGGVSFGMPALDGAVEGVRLVEDGTISLDVIGGGVPLGICGSGLVDALSELRRTGRMNSQGRFAEDAAPIVLDPAGRICLSEIDVNELAQAKGANAAGLRVLAEVYGVGLDRIDRVYLAGGFARHIDVDAACRIGLIPDVPRDRIAKVGNASLAGASVALLSRRRREALEALVRRVELVRLEAHPRFFDFFVQGCQFDAFGGSA
jgi:uncharacterized 2Fe-2S/4Fe-4S cluster protein (DUF4445 family)